MGCVYERSVFYCILLMLDGLFYICQMCGAELPCAYWFFIYLFHQLWRKGNWNLLSIIVYLSVSPFSSMSFASCILKVSLYVHESLTFLSISSWWIDSFIIMKWLCLSLVMFFGLKSTLPNVYWATYSSFFWLVLVWCIFLYPLLLI